MEIVTYVFPASFLILAAAANSLKQISMLTSSATRNTIYRSFARLENIGDITAKGRLCRFWVPMDYRVAIEIVDKGIRCLLHSLTGGRRGRRAAGGDGEGLAESEHRAADLVGIRMLQIRPLTVHVSFRTCEHRGRLCYHPAPQYTYCRRYSLDSAAYPSNFTLHPREFQFLQPRTAIPSLKQRSARMKAFCDFQRLPNNKVLLEQWGFNAAALEPWGCRFLFAGTTVGKFFTQAQSLSSVVPSPSVQGRHKSLWLIS